MPKKAVSKKAKFRTRLAIAAAVTVVGALLLACGVGGKTSPTGDGAQVGTGSGQPVIAEPSYHIPAAADFTLTIKILEKQCFGSAGCLIDYRIELAYNGTVPLDPKTTYEVTYEVRGGTDTKINTLEVTGAEYERDNKESLQTKSSKNELTAVVTSVTR